LIKSAIKLREARPCHLLKRPQFCGHHGIALLDQAQSPTQNLARVLIAAGPDEVGNDFLMLRRENDITCWNQRFPLSEFALQRVWHMMPTPA